MKIEQHKTGKIEPRRKRDTAKNIQDIIDVNEYIDRINYFLALSIIYHWHLKKYSSKFNF